MNALRVLKLFLSTALLLGCAVYKAFRDMLNCGYGETHFLCSGDCDFHGKRHRLPSVAGSGYPEAPELKFLGGQARCGGTACCRWVAKTEISDARPRPVVASDRCLDYGHCLSCQQGIEHFV